MKKIINTPDTLMMEMCNGIVMAHPELELIKKYKIIKKKDINTDKVTLISGGGSGHEPAMLVLLEKECWTSRFVEKYLPLLLKYKFTRL
ncbi:hypothetical protein IRB23SM22_17690 [Alkalibacterium sp. s-m-22]